MGVPVLIPIKYEFIKLNLAESEAKTKIMVQEKSEMREQQEEEYEFFKAGIDGRKEGEKGTDKRFGKPLLLVRKFQS